MRQKKKKKKISLNFFENRSPWYGYEQKIPKILTSLRQSKIADQRRSGSIGSKLCIINS
jgi:hypothetical protein